MKRTLWAASVVAMLGCGVEAASAQNCDGWWAIGDPEPRINAALASDTARGVLVLHGGVAFEFDSESYLNNTSTETWEFDGSAWSFRSIDGPTARVYESMAFDARRGVTVLFGGRTYNPATHRLADESNETWEWDGDQWHQRTIAGPLGRSRHAMAFDAARNQVVLYGGTTGPSEMWLFDGGAWAQVPQQAVWPGDRVGAALAFDPGRGVVVLHSPGAPTMEWNGVSWRVASESSPPADRAELAFDSTSGLLIATTKSQDDQSLVAWDGSAWTSVQSSPATIPGTHRLASMPGSGIATVGLPRPATTQQAREMGYLWANGTLTAMPKYLSPAPMQFGVMAFDTRREEAVLVVRAPMSPLSQTWVLQGQTWKHILQSSQSPGLSTGSTVNGMGYDEGRDELILVSSRVSRRAGGGTWAFLSPPSSSAVAGASYSPVYGLMFLAGGRMYRWNGVALERWGLANVVESYQAGFAFDPVRDRGVAVTQGGSTRLFSPSSDSWTPISYNSPTSSFNPQMAYAPERNGVVLFGGFSLPLIGTRGFANTTYFLGSNSNTWETLPIRGPMGRKRHALAYDPVSQRITMFGGLAGHEGSLFLGGTWFLSAGPSTIVRESGGMRAAPGGHAEFSIRVTGGGPMTFEWYKDSQRIHDSESIAGSSTDTLILTGTTWSDAGMYHCVVANRCGSDTSTPMPLGVGCPADLDDDGAFSNGAHPDGLADINDLLYFLQAFEAGDAGADISGGRGEWTPDEAVTIDDLLYFLDRFDTGC